jgi:voltage-gated potassium channel
VPSKLERRLDAKLERITRNPLRGAWWATLMVTLTVTIIAGVLIRLTDPDTYPNIWQGLWWAIQTTTTVGYGDVVPESAGGRVIAAFVMVVGLAFIAVSTAAITSAFLEAARRRRSAEGEHPLVAEMRELQRQVERLTTEVRAGGVTGGPGRPS